MSNWRSFPWWPSNMANGLVLVLPRHSLSIQFSSILALATSHLENWEALCLSQGVTACLCIMLSPSPLLHIPSGPLSFTPLSTFSLWQAPRCSALQWLKVLSAVMVLFLKKVTKVMLWANECWSPTVIYVGFITCAECEQIQVLYYWFSEENIVLILCIDCIWYALI